MRDIWVISDTHYNQSSILDFYDHKGRRLREFNSVKEMNERILDGWNSVVKPNDIVYHLGDVFHDEKKTDNREKFEADWPLFHGHKRLIVGNHDDIAYLSGKDRRGTKFFEKIMMWRKYPEFGIIMSHVPLHESSLYSSLDFSKKLKNIHGHIHSMESPEGPYVNVSVEAIDYTPVHIEELRNR